MSSTEYFRGYVVDYLDFHWQSWHWPAFNLADVFIVLGVIMISATSFRTQKSPDEQVEDSRSKMGNYGREQEEESMHSELKRFFRAELQAAHEAENGAISSLPSPILNAPISSARNTLWRTPQLIY